MFNNKYLYTFLSPVYFLQIYVPVLIKNRNIRKTYQTPNFNFWFINYKKYFLTDPN